MKNCIISIDLGSTNLKFSLYDESFSLLSFNQTPVEYIEYDGNKVEFNVELYMEQFLSGIEKLLQNSSVDPMSVKIIALTGQAESFIVTGDDGPLCNAISWKDSRSQKECYEIEKHFSRDKWFSTTGLPQISTTWPVTKLLWLKKNSPELFASIKRFYLVKDYVVYQITRKYCSEYSVFSFSGFLNLGEKKIWKELLSYLDMNESQLPCLVEPGSIVGFAQSDFCKRFGFPNNLKVSSGVLDHVGGMIGTGNLLPGKISVSAGTVQALAMQSEKFVVDDRMIECHYGFEPNSFIQLYVLESGGICLQWFRDNFLPSKSFKAIDELIPDETKVLFLPYICGLNPPEYDAKAKGVFWGFDVYDNVFDFALAVMEANAFLLRKNLEFLQTKNVWVSDILFMGGISKSPKFSQIISDVIGKPVVIFESYEPPSLGAAIIASVEAGWVPNIAECVKKAVRVERVYQPHCSSYYANKYKKFIDLYLKLFS